LRKIAPEEAIEDKFLVKIGLVGLGSVVLLLVLRDFIKHLIPFNMALASLIPSFAILVIKGSYPKLKNLINEIDIETLVFFSGLFVIVGGLEETGIIKSVAKILNRFAYSGFKMMSVLFWTGAMTSSIIDWKNKFLIPVRISSFSDIDFTEKIPQPKKYRIIAWEVVNLSITPGVAFDIYGHRIGMGGGFYDRFFSVFKKIFKVALSFDFQVLDEKLPVEENDHKMDVIITENGILTFNNSNN